MTLTPEDIEAQVFREKCAGMRFTYFYQNKLWNTASVIGSITRFGQYSFLPAGEQFHLQSLVMHVRDHLGLAFAALMLRARFISSAPLKESSPVFAKITHCDWGRGQDPCSTSINELSDGLGPAPLPPAGRLQDIFS